MFRGWNILTFHFCLLEMHPGTAISMALVFELAVAYRVIWVIPWAGCSRYAFSIKNVMYIQHFDQIPPFTWCTPLQYLSYPFLPLPFPHSFLVWFFPLNPFSLACVCLGCRAICWSVDSLSGAISQQVTDHLLLSQHPSGANSSLARHGTS